MLNPLPKRVLQLFSGEGIRAQLLRGGLGSLLIKASGALSAFAAAVVLARVLGPDAYGIYSYALALLMLVAIPVQVGIPQLVVRETAKAQACSDWSLMRGLWRWSNGAVLVLSLLGAVVVGITLLLLTQNEGGRVATALLGIALIPLIALANVRSASLRGLKKVVWGQLPESVFRPLLLLAMLYSWVLLSPSDSIATASEAMTFHVGAAIMAFALGSWMLWKVRPAQLRRKPAPPPRYDYVTWRKAILPLAMISGLQLVNNYTDLIVLGIFFSDMDVGVYRAAAQLSMLVVFGLQAINQVLHPYFASMYVKGDMTGLQRLVTVSSRAITLLALPPVILFLFFGDYLLVWVYGEPYKSGSIVLAVLAIGQFFNSFMGSVGALLNMTGHERDSMKGMMVAALANVVMNIILIPLWGMDGAAVATSMTLVIWNFVLRKFVIFRLNIESLAFNLTIK